MKRIIAMLVTIVMIMACAVPVFASQTAEYSNSAGGYSVPASMTIHVGEKKTLIVKEPDGKYGNVSYGYDPTYVRSSGYSAGAYWGKPAQITFEGLEPGTFEAYVTIEVHRQAGVPKSAYATHTICCNIKVVGNETAPDQKTKQGKVALKKIALNKSKTTLAVGKSVRLTVSYTPGNTTEKKTVTWSSSNPKVASVKNGKVKAKKAGTAKITAKVGTKTASCKITVKAASKKSSSKKDSKSGTYRNVKDAYTILNKFRTTKKNQWYWNSNNTKKIKTKNLKKVKKDNALEKIAKLRAKEQWIMYFERGQATHERPNGKAWYTAYGADIRNAEECLGWGYQTSESVITDGWAETDQKYEGQGHRRTLLNSQATKVGIACYEKDGLTCWALCMES